MSSHDISAIIATDEEQLLINQVQKGLERFNQAEAKLKGLSVQTGEPLYKLRALGRKDKAKYTVVRPGHSKPEQVGRFDAVIASFGLSRATAYRHLNAYEQHLMETTPIPQSVTDLVTSTGVLNLDDKDDLQALQRAFLDEGQPSKLTPHDCMSIISKACDAAKEARSEEQASEAEEIVKSLNGVFTSSYRRVIGVPQFKKEKGQPRRFIGVLNNQGNLIDESALESVEREWASLMQTITKNIPLTFFFTENEILTIVGLGRGEQSFSLTTIAVEQAA